MPAVHHILLVKTSSLGDVVHNLPVVNDIRRFDPAASIDWVVEESFAAVPALHPGVRRVITCALRHWRSAWMSRSTRSQWRGFVARLRSERYDAVIDTQGLFKSALVACVAYGRRIGLDWRSSREPLRLFYDQVFDVPWNMHAVERNRRLCALALGYEVSGDPDYGIRCEPSRAPWLPQRPYVVLLHGTSHARKLWPEPFWFELGGRLTDRGFDLILPWGGDEEHSRAKRLAARLTGSCVAPRLGLDDIAAVIAGAAAVVGVDTGLTHLAAALGVPVVGIYGATDPRATGIRAVGPAINLGAVGSLPSVEDTFLALQRLGVVAAYPKRGHA